MNINGIFGSVMNRFGLNNNNEQIAQKQNQALLPTVSPDGWLGALYRNLDSGNMAGATGLARAFETNSVRPQVEIKPLNEINGLRAGEAITVNISAKDTQESVLRKTYTAYADKAELSFSSKQQFVEQMMKSGGTQILHAGTNTAFTDAEFAAKRAHGSIEMIPSDGQITELRTLKIKDLLSYGVFDWSVSTADERQVVDLLKSDPNLSATVKNLNQSGTLEALMTRVDEPVTRRELIGVLAANADDEASKLIEPQVRGLDIATLKDGDANLWQVQYRLTRMGVKPSEQTFERKPYSNLISDNPSVGFSGVGATGKSPTETSVPLLDQWGLYREDAETTAKYSNPIPGSLSDYLDGVGTDNRRRQAELLLRQPVSSTMPEIFGGQPPSRADVIKAAAAKYNLDPRMVAAIVLERV